jgi:hypothetical protein
MSVSEHANYLLNEYGRLQFDYAAYCKPYGESLRNEARNNLEEYIAELEDAQRWTPVSEKLPEANTPVLTISKGNDVATPIDVALRKRIAGLEAAQRWIPVSERLPDGGHREFYEVACIYQDFGELALFSKGRWVIYEGENIYDVTDRVMFWRKRQYLPDEVIAILSKGKAKPEVQE